MLFTILLKLFYRVTGKFIVELEQIRYSLSLDIDQRQKEKREVFFRIIQLGISEYVFYCLKDRALPQAHRDYLGKYTFFKMLFLFSEGCELQWCKLLNKLPYNFLGILIVLFLH